jgi:hypothetical protein
MMAGDSAVTVGMGNSDGEEDYEDPTVDDGRCPHLENAGA